MFPLSDADAQRVEEVFATHRRYIETVARQHAPTPDDVPDVVQQVAVQLCRGLHRFRGDSDIRTWLWMVTRNAAVGAWRKQRQRQRLEEAYVQARPTDTAISPDEEVAARERREALTEAIERLPDVARELLRHEMATGITQTNSRARWTRYRARRRVRVLLETDPRMDRP